MTSREATRAEARPPREGRMTAVMRAMARPRGPRVPRVAVVEGGRVIDERIFSPGETVTLGSSEQASVIVAGAPFEAAPWIVARGGGYELHLATEMRGRVVLDDEAHDLEKLRATGPARVPLDPSARGRIELGGATLLFQLVEPPARVARGALPPSLERGPLGDIDWTTTIVAAFSFLAHFLAVALVYSDWTDPVVNDELAVVTLAASLETLPPAPALEHPPGESAPGATTGRPAGTHAARRSGGAAAGAAAGAPTGTPKAGADARAAEIASELAALDVGTLTALGGRAATHDVLDEDEVPAGLLDDAGRNAAGVRVDEGEGGLRFAGDESRGMRPGEKRRALADIGDGRARADAMRQGRERPVEGPRGSVDVAPTPEGPAIVPNADAVVAGMRARFRACYQKALPDHPEMQGSVTLVAKIGPNGEVTNVSGGSGALAPVVPCLKAVVHGGAFAPPKTGGQALVTIPIRFLLQR